MSACVREADGRVTLSNDWIGLGFGLGQNGALVSVLDKATGCELLRDGDAPRLLWRLALRRQGDKELEWIESDDAGKFSWEERQTDDTLTLTLNATDFRKPEHRTPNTEHSPGDIAVAVEISIAPGSPLSSWRMRVTGVPDDDAVHQLICPVVSGLVRMGDPAPGESLAVPVQSEGYLFRNPFPVRDRLPLCSGIGPEAADVGVGKVGALYPGALALQMYAFYNDTAGLYFAAHDAGEHVKAFEMGAWEQWGGTPVLSMAHFPGETPGTDTAIDYECMVGVFHGDWCDAAGIYREWARQQWWCEKKLAERDIAEWMRKGFGVWQMSNYHIPKLDLNHSLDQIAGKVNELAEETGVPLLGLVFNYEGGGAWTGPEGMFPPREGEEAFRGAMRRMREAGNLGFIYMPGGNWYIAIDSYDPPFDSREAFEAEGRPNAIVNEHGDVHIGEWYPGWHCARVCPATPFTLEMTKSLLLGAVERGCPVVQIDNFPCGGPDACFNPAHDHPPGHGPWFAAAWRRILADVRREAKALDPDCAISVEGIGENYIPYLDLFDQRAGNMEYFGHYGRGMPMGGETIPIFSYVYNEYIGAYCAAYPECNRPEVLYWTRCLGKALVQGVVPSGGRYMPTPAEDNPVTIAFYKKVVRATAQECWPYVMFGEMLRPPEIDVPTITAQYCKFNYEQETYTHRSDPLQRHEVTDTAVQCGTFRGPDGTIASIFVNVSEEPVSFEFELSAHGMGAEAYDVERVTDGAREAWLSETALPRRERIEMQPLSVVVVVVRGG